MSKLLVGLGTAVSLIAVTTYVVKRNGYDKKFLEWKKERIHDAYYNTLTEKDVAWG